MFGARFLFLLPVGYAQVVLLSRCPCGARARRKGGAPRNTARAAYRESAPAMTGWGVPPPSDTAATAAASRSGLASICWLFESPPAFIRGEGAGRNLASTGAYRSPAALVSPRDEV